MKGRFRTAMAVAVVLCGSACGADEAPGVPPEASGTEIFAGAAPGGQAAIPEPPWTGQLDTQGAPASLNVSEGEVEGGIGDYAAASWTVMDESGSAYDSGLDVYLHLETDRGFGMVIVHLWLPELSDELAPGLRVSSFSGEALPDEPEMFLVACSGTEPGVWDYDAQAFTSSLDVTAEGSDEMQVSFQGDFGNGDRVTGRFLLTQP